MRIIGGPLGAINPSLVRAYIDTEVVFVRFWGKSGQRVPYPPPELRTIKKMQKDRGVLLRLCRDRGRTWGYVLVVHQPTLGSIRELNKMKVAYGAQVCRRDIAVDLVGPNASAIKDWLVTHASLRWRPNGQMYDFRSTTYWTWQKERIDGITTKRKRKHSRRDLVVYADKPCRATGQNNCLHLELRFYGSDSVRKTRFARTNVANSILGLNPRQLFARHVQLVDFDLNAFKKKMMRQALLLSPRPRRIFRFPYRLPFMESH